MVKSKCILILSMAFIAVLTYNSGVYSQEKSQDCIQINLFGTEKLEDDNLKVGGLLPGVINIQNFKKGFFGGNKVQIISENKDLIFSEKLDMNMNFKNGSSALTINPQSGETRFFIAPSKTEYPYSSSGDYSTSIQFTYKGKNYSNSVNITSKLLIYRGRAIKKAMDLNDLSKPLDYTRESKNAMKGIVLPSGWGKSDEKVDLKAHLIGVENTIFNSWTTDYRIALYFSLIRNFDETLPPQQSYYGTSSIMQKIIENQEFVIGPRISDHSWEQEVSMLGMQTALGVDLFDATFFNGQFLINHVNFNPDYAVEKKSVNLSYKSYCVAVEKN